MSKIRNSIILGDVDLLIERFTLLTDSYRLLVRASEELTRTPSVGENIIEQAVCRTAFRRNPRSIITGNPALPHSGLCQGNKGSENPYV